MKIIVLPPPQKTFKVTEMAALVHGEHDLVEDTSVSLYQGSDFINSLAQYRTIFPSQHVWPKV